MPFELHKALKLIAVENALSMSEIIYSLVKNFIKEEKKLQEE